jgi:hypothetical protein
MTTVDEYPAPDRGPGHLALFARISRPGTSRDARFYIGRDDDNAIVVIVTVDTSETVRSYLAPATSDYDGALAEIRGWVLDALRDRIDRRGRDGA